MAMAERSGWLAWGAIGAAVIATLVAPDSLQWYASGALLGLLLLALALEFGRSRAVRLRVQGLRRSTTQRRLSWLMYATFFFAPLTALRAGEAINVGDVFMYLVLGCAIFTGRMHQPRGYGLMLAGVYALVAGGALATWLFSDQTGESVALIVRLAVGIAAPLLAVCWWKPTRREIEIAVYAFGAGVAVSVASAALGNASWGRFYGLTLHPVLLGLACTLAIMGLIGARSRHPWLAVAGIAIAGYGLIETGTRSALIALVIAIAAFIVARGERRVIQGTALVVTAVVLLVAGGFVKVSDSNVLSRLAGDDSAIESDAGRASAGSQAWRIIEEHPLTGAGLASSRPVDTLPTISAAHSVPLAVWSSAGVLGLGGFLLFAVAAWRIWRGSRIDSLACALACGFVGYITFSMVATQIWERFVWLMVALGVEALRVARADQQQAADAAGDHQPLSGLRDR